MQLLGFGLCSSFIHASQPVLAGSQIAECIQARQPNDIKPNNRTNLGQITEWQIAPKLGDLRNGAYGLVEIKPGGDTAIEHGAVM